MLRFRFALSAAIIALCGASAAHAQLQTVWDSFEYRSMLDADDPQNHPRILDEARLAVLDQFSSAWLAQSRSADDRRARQQALEAARATPGEYVSLQVKHGPFVRPGTHGYVSARAEVRSDALERLYAAKQRQARSAPRHKVLVLINEEKVVGVPRYVRERNEISKATTAIQGALAASGWTVIDGQQFEVIRERNLDYARLGQTGEQLIARIAKEQGAQIIIRGSVKAEGPRQRQLGGQMVQFFSVDCALKAVWADTGAVIFTISEPPGQRTAGTREAGLNGAERALEQVSEHLGELCRRQFANITSAQELSVIIKHVESLEQEVQVRKWCNAVTGADAVRGAEFSGTRLILTIESDLSAYDFAVRLSDISNQGDAMFILRQDARSTNNIEFSVALR